MNIFLPKRLQKFYLLDNCLKKVKKMSCWDIKKHYSDPKKNIALLKKHVRYFLLHQHAQIF